MVMEHAEALEHIEIAAAEPDGLDRLMAGDTSDAAAVAGHLAGCPMCAEELVRIRRTSVVAREVIRAEPDPALRERTLAFVRAVGRDRSSPAIGAVAAQAVEAPGVPVGVAGMPAFGDAASTITVLPAAAGSSIGGSTTRTDAKARRRGWALLAAAAAVVIAVGVGYAIGGSAQRADLEASAREVAVLSDAATTALRVEAQPDAQRVPLTPTAAGDDATGTLTFSASTGELVALAAGLEPEGSNEEYACWVEVDGARRRLGKMYWAGDVWTWAGPVDGLAGLPPGAVFGVSLSAGDGAPNEPVLTGDL
jgi:hypothetical protein